MVQEQLDCTDVMAFQEGIGRLRKVDDRIIYSLNEALAKRPSGGAESEGRAAEACASLQTRLREAHASRLAAVSACVDVARQSLDSLRAEAAGGAKAPDFPARLAHARLLLRTFSTEVAVEHITAQRSDKALHDRCRPALPTH